MADDPLDAVYSYVERAYVRLQAGDILLRCLEEGSPEPIHQMVEGLVLAGSRSLATLQEILAETGERKTQILDDLHQVFSEFEKVFYKAGLELADLKDRMSIVILSKMELHRLLREHGIRREGLEAELIQRLETTRELMAGMARQIRLLEDIECFLQDWIWGLAYERTHQPPERAKGIRGEQAC